MSKQVRCYSILKKTRKSLSSTRRNLAVKLAAILLVASSVATQASTFAQRVSLSLNNAKLEDVFKAISQQTNYRFFYSDDVLKQADNVSITISNASVDEVLERVLDAQKFAVKVVSETVTISLKSNTPAIENNRTNANQSIVIGMVRDTGGQPISGATIRVVRSRRSVTTDGNGVYRINAQGDDILEISYVGYRTTTVNVQNRSTIDITLQESAQEIETVDVVTTGYQSIDRRRFTGASTRVDAKDAERAGIPDVSRMLEGQVAGVSVQNVSGTFGAAPKIRVRGATSITGDNKPLWVVDGIILEDVVNVSNDQLSSGDPNTLLGSSVAGLNPDDIESFEILKDAAATSLYGARAMNGVIVITTKRGRPGVSNISYTTNLTSYLKPSYSQFDIINSYDQMSIYAELERKGLINYALIKNYSNSGIYGNLSNALVSWNPDGTPVVENTSEARRAYLERYVYQNTDWFDVLFKNSFMQEHSLSGTTGNDKAQMYYSTSYLRDAGWTVGSAVSRYTANVRGTFNINDKLSFGLITTGSIRDQLAPGTLGQDTNPLTGVVARDFDINPFSYAMNSSRTIAPYTQDGRYEYVTMNYAPFNILEELENNYMEVNMIDLKVQGEAKYNIFDKLVYNFAGAYRYVSTGNEHKILDNSNMANAYRAGTIYDISGEENSTVADANRFLYLNPDDPDGRPKTVLPYGGIYSTNDNLLKSYYLRNSLDWEHIYVDRHLVRFAAFQELRYLDRISRSNTGYGYQFDKGGVPYIDPNVIKMSVEGNQSYYSMGVFRDRFIAVAGNANYSYDGKYQVVGTLRYDGSNQMGESSTARWLPTWNISGSWNMDREGFMERQNFFDELTIRGTYGLTASMGNATNSSLVLNSRTTYRPWLYELEPVINITHLSNTALTWEKMYEANLGVDMMFLKRKYQVVVDLYRRNSFDLIGDMLVSGIGGEYQKTANYADMSSRGIEVLFKANLIRNTNFSWTTQLTNAYNSAEVTRLANRPMIYNMVANIGGAKVGYPPRGLFSIDFQRLSEERGVPEYVNQDGTISNNVYLQSIFTDYLKYEGPVDPTFNGGFHNSLTYKEFSVSALLTYSAGNKVRLNPIYKNAYSDLDAMSYDFLDRFLVARDELSPSIADVRTESRLPGGQVYNAYNYSDQRVADGGFVRLKQVTFGYRLPDRLVSGTGFKNISINAVANNLWLIYSDPNLNGQDPEFYGSGGVALPIPRQLTLSIKANL